MTRAELLALHQADRRAHFQHDVDALLATLPPEFIFVREGQIQQQTQDESSPEGFGLRGGNFALKYLLLFVRLVLLCLPERLGRDLGTLVHLARLGLQLRPENESPLEVAL